MCGANCGRGLTTRRVGVFMPAKGARAMGALMKRGG
jgi:hypothetical protein